MQLIKKRYKLIIILLIIVELIMIFLSVKSLNNKPVDNEKEKVIINKEKFAMYINEGDGIYEKYNDDNMFPMSKYLLNFEKSKCYDLEQNEVKNIISYTRGKITITSSVTVFCHLYFDFVENIEPVELEYTGNYQEYMAKLSGYYYIEASGAQGSTSGGTGGLGSLTSGYIYLYQGEKIYAYVGGAADGLNGGYNGGGNGSARASTNSAYKDGGGGGGATDIRYFFNYTPTVGELEWNTILGLNSRIMVAAGGGGGSYISANYAGGNAGTLIGLTGTGRTLTIDGGSQIGGYKFGEGQEGFPASSSYSWGESGRGGGGAGYYGGAASQTGANGIAGGGGGSSFISGYAGVNAISNLYDEANPRNHTDNTLHFSGKYFVNGKMKSGVNEGNGNVKIEYIGKILTKIDEKLNNVRYIKDCINGNSANTGNHWIELQAIINGINIAYGKTVTGTSTQESSHPYTRITDGDITTTNYAESSTTGSQCIIVDLEDKYDLDEVAVWHYYGDGRSYNNHSLYVSSDNSKWTTIIDNQSGVSETSNGIRYQTNYSSDEYLVKVVGLENTSITLEITVLEKKEVKNYYYSIDGNDYIRSTNNTYKFQNLNKDSNYELKVYIEYTDGSISEVKKLFVTTSKNLGNYLLNIPTNGLNTSTLEGGMYRYQGTDVNNYVCFGTSDLETCLSDTDKYMYRIIGINENKEVKVIKSEALNTLYAWHSSYTTNIKWPSSLLYNNINNTAFYNNTTYINNDWKNMIKLSNWKYGDLTNSSISALDLYNKENGNYDANGGEIDGYIGLMYLHDFAYSLSGGVNCWETSICNTSWLSILNADANSPSTHDWLMTRYGYRNNSDYTAYIIISGVSYDIERLTNTRAVRPVFYLNEDTMYYSGTGTSNDPIILNKLDLEVVKTSDSLNSITVEVDSLSSKEISKYYYSINDNNFVSSVNNTYTFTGLNAGTNYQIKVYAEYVDDTTSTITTTNFATRKNEYVISDTSTNLWGTPSVGQSGAYDSAYAGGFDGGIKIGVWDCWMGYEDVTFSCPNSISTSGYTTLYITYEYSSSVYGYSKNVGININGTTIDRSFYDNNVSGTKTLSYNVTNLSSITLSGYAQTYDQGGCSSMDVVITKTWLE